MKAWDALAPALFVSSGSALQVPPYKNPSLAIDVRVRDLLSRMTLDEKIGQMTQADRQFVKPESDIESYYLGSLLSGGGSAPPENKPARWAEMYDSYQRLALSTRLAIPLIYGIDAVHGHNSVMGATIFPQNIGMGCTRNPKLVEAAARATAAEVAATGIDWTFAPCIAVPQDERWGRTYEGFGETAELAEMMGAAEVRGFEGDAGQLSILATAKHFLGDGGTQAGVDQGDTIVNEVTLRAVHLPGYRAAVNAGVGSIMASYSSINSEKMHGNRHLLTDVLKGELGFHGFVVSDWKAIDRLPGDFEDDVTEAINAGIDMVMVPDDYRTFISTLKKLAGNGRVPMSRIDDAVGRILTQKFRFGLFERPLSDPSLLPQVGSAEHRQIARQAVRESLVLLLNNNRTLPLSPDAGSILVAGKSADDLGNQCGGWTISWQGASGPVTTGTTILQGIRNAAPKAQVAYSREGEVPSGAKAAIVVIGERPYAESQGDRVDLYLDNEDISTVRRVHAAGIPTVVVLLSGRPMIVEPIVASADALVAAWLPGSEGDGVADVLFGRYHPSGKLGHSWPRSMTQIPINVGPQGEKPAGYDRLFPYGFGLTY
jgi:beta-glucosidase